MSFSEAYLNEVADLAYLLPAKQIETLVEEIANCRDRDGTLYIVGLGGSAANASHMAADFRKLCMMDVRSLENMAEVTARANDEGWSTIFDGFLSNINSYDALFVLSVGGGTPTVSLPLITAIDMAKAAKARVFGIVGPHGGYTAEQGDCVIKVPCESNQTPHTEAFQAVIWHCLVSHPSLQRKSTKWV